MQTPTPLDLAREIRAEMGRQKVTAASLARSTDITAATLSRRFSAPEDFTLGEFERIATALGLTMADLVARAQAVAA